MWLIIVVASVFLLCCLLFIGIIRSLGGEVGWGTSKIEKANCLSKIILRLEFWVSTACPVDLQVTPKEPCLIKKKPFWYISIEPHLHTLVGTFQYLFP